MAFDLNGALMAWRKPVGIDPSIPEPRYEAEGMDREGKHDKVTEAIGKLGPALFSHAHLTAQGYAALLQGRAAQVDGKEVVSSERLLEQVDALSKIVLARLLDAKERKAPLTEKQQQEIQACFQELSAFWQAKAEQEPGVMQITAQVKVLSDNVPYVLKACEAFVQQLDLFSNHLKESIEAIDAEPAVKEATLSLSGMFFDESLFTAAAVAESLSAGKVDFTRIKFEDAELASKKALLGIFAKAAKEGRPVNEQELASAKELINTWKDRMITLERANKLQAKSASKASELEQLKATMKSQEALFKKRVLEETADLQAKQRDLKEFEARNALSLKTDVDLKEAIEKAAETRKASIQEASRKLEETKEEQAKTLGELAEDIRQNEEAFAALTKETRELMYNQFYYPVSFVQDFNVQPATLEAMALIAENLDKLAPLFAQYAQFAIGKADREPKAQSSGLWRLLGY